MSSETLAGILFVVIVAITIGITFWASRQTSGTTDYYAGGRSFSGFQNCLLYTSPSPRDKRQSRMPSSA